MNNAIAVNHCKDVQSVQWSIGKPVEKKVYITYYRCKNTYRFDVILKNASGATSSYSFYRYENPLTGKIQGSLSKLIYGALRSGKNLKVVM